MFYSLAEERGTNLLGYYVLQPAVQLEPCQAKVGGFLLTRKFFFLHNPKAGGSSLRKLIAGVNGGQSVAPQFLNAPCDYRMNRTKIEIKETFDFYFGHYGYEIYEKLKTEYTLITNFRDPINRVYSMYRYWRNNVPKQILSSLYKNDADVVLLAKDLNFSNFIRSHNEDLSLYINNFHFRQIYFSGWSQINCDEEMERIVRLRIDSMPWFYVAETPEASMTLFRSCFPEYGNVSLGQENISGGPSNPIDPADADFLISKNLLDYAIHAYALTVQAGRLAALARGSAGA